VEHLCARSGLPSPAWTEEPGRFLEEWWLVSGLRNLDATALVQSPISLSGEACSSAMAPLNMPDLCSIVRTSWLPFRLSTKSLRRGECGPTSSLLVELLWPVGDVEILNQQAEKS